MTTISIFIIAHIVAGCYNYWFTKVAYSKNGRWSNLNPGRIDAVISFMPIVSILATFVNFATGGPYRENYKESKSRFNWSKFFNVKKD